MTALLVITSYLTYSNSRCKYRPIRAKKKLTVELVKERALTPLAGTVADVAWR